jgi:hypothetical protein
VRALGKRSIIKFGDRRNQIAGMLVFTLGVFVIVESLNYDIGTAAQTGPGFLPLGLGILTLIFGPLIACVNHETSIAGVMIPWRPTVLVLAGVLAFALLIESAGLILATGALVFIAGSADPAHTWRSLFHLFLFLTTAVYVIFKVFLSIPFQLVIGIV